MFINIGSAHCIQVRYSLPDRVQLGAIQVPTANGAYSRRYDLTMLIRCDPSVIFFWSKKLRIERRDGRYLVRIRQWILTRMRYLRKSQSRILLSMVERVVRWAWNLLPQDLVMLRLLQNALCPTIWVQPHHSLRLVSHYLKPRIHQLQFTLCWLREVDYLFHSSLGIQLLSLVTRVDAIILRLLHILRFVH